jgi:hypothetical protein
MKNSYCLICGSSTRLEVGKLCNECPHIRANNKGMSLSEKIGLDPQCSWVSMYPWTWAFLEERDKTK